MEKYQDRSRTAILKLARVTIIKSIWVGVGGASKKESQPPLKGRQMGQHVTLWCESLLTNIRMNTF